MKAPAATLSFAALTVAGLFMVVGAQEPSFRAGTRLVRLDVTVLGADGEPVRDLTAGDFRVTERGRDLRVRAFDSVSVDASAVASGSGALTGEPTATSRSPSEITVGPDVHGRVARSDEPEIGDGRLVVLVMDDDMTPANPKWRTQAIATASAIVAGLRPADRIAVQFTRVGKTTLELTTDRAVTLAAIETFVPGGYLALPPILSGGIAPSDETPRYRKTMLALEYTTEAIATVTERQKVIVYIGPGLPLSTSDPDFGRYLNDLFRSAARSNVVIYTFDPSGLETIEDYVAERYILAYRTRPSPGGRSMPMSEIVQNSQGIARRIARLTNEFSATMAENTGGRFLTKSDIFEPAVAQMFRDTSFYYLIAVEPLDSKPDGRFHEVRVSVNRPGVAVRARRGYYYQP